MNPFDLKEGNIVMSIFKDGTRALYKFISKQSFSTYLFEIIFTDNEEYKKSLGKVLPVSFSTVESECVMLCKSIDDIPAHQTPYKIKEVIKEVEVEKIIKERYVEVYTDTVIDRLYAKYCESKGRLIEYV